MKRSILFPTILFTIVAVLAAGWLGLDLTRAGSSAAQSPASAGGPAATGGGAPARATGTASRGRPGSRSICPW